MNDYPDLAKFRQVLHDNAVKGDWQRFSDNVDVMITVFGQLRREVAEAEQRVRRAEADAAALRRALDILTRAGDAESARAVASAMLKRLDAGATLLAELEAARALLHELLKQPGIVRTAALDTALDAYNAVPKGGAR